MDGFAEYVTARSGRLRRIAYVLTGDWSTADDLVQTTLARGEIYTTLEVKVNLVRAITKDTGRVRATGRLIHRGRTTSTAEGDIRDGAGNLLAHGTTTCVIFPAKSK